MKQQITRSNLADWKPLVEEGIEGSGIYVKQLRLDEFTKRSPTFLLRFEAGTSYPWHNHPAGEEVFVLEGEVQFGQDQLIAGDYLYTPPGTKHAAFSRTGCTMLFVVPEEVEIL